MSNDYRLHITWAQYKKALESVSVTTPPRQSELDPWQADDVGHQRRCASDALCRRQHH